MVDRMVLSSALRGSVTMSVRWIIIVRRHALLNSKMFSISSFRSVQWRGLLALLHHAMISSASSSPVPAQPGKDGAAEQKQQIEQYTDPKQNGPYLVPRHGNSPYVSQQDRILK